MAQGKKYIANDKDRQLAEQMAAVGIVHEQIAAVLKICVDTLVKYYKDELETARSKANARIAGALYNKALKGDTASMIFWLKTRAGWNETYNINSENKNYVISGEPLSEEEFERKYRIGMASATEAKNIT